MWVQRETGRKKKKEGRRRSGSGSGLAKREKSNEGKVRKCDTSNELICVIISDVIISDISDG